jgi:hypothetical protein
VTDRSWAAHRMTCAVMVISIVGNDPRPARK